MKVDIKVLEKFKGEIEALNLSGEIEAFGPSVAHKYYEYLRDNNESYGAAALQVATNTGILGRFANIHLRTQAIFDGKNRSDLESLQTNIVVSLAYADMVQRIKHDGELTYDIISKYHKLTFETYGLTHYAWGGLAVEELLGSGKWMMLHDMNQLELEGILAQLRQVYNDGTKYATGRMISSMHHTLKCLLSTEEDYLPIVPDSSPLQVAKRFGVDISRVERCDDAILSGVQSQSYKILAMQHIVVRDEMQSDAGGDEDGQSHDVQMPLLFHLIYSGDIIEATQLILSNTINVHERSSDNMTALHVASEEGVDEIVRLLLQKGALINAADDWGFTPLHHAAFNRAFYTAQILLATGANTTITDLIGKRTALHYAVGSGSLRMTELFVKNGFVIDAKNGDDETPLDVAQKMGYPEIVNFLAGEMHYFD